MSKKNRLIDSYLCESPSHQYAEKLVDDVGNYIERYRVVSLSNLLSRYTNITKKDLMGITSVLCRKGRVSYDEDNNSYSNGTIYYSTHFNITKQNVIFDNEAVAIFKCLTCLEEFRRYYTVTYERLGFFPSVISFGASTDQGLLNLQIIYLPYTDRNEMAQYMSRFFDRAYDEKFDIYRYVVFERPGMLNDEFVRTTLEHIPRVQGFAVVSDNGQRATFYSKSDFGVKDNND